MSKGTNMGSAVGLDYGRVYYTVHRWALRGQITLDKSATTPVFDWIIEKFGEPKDWEPGFADRICGPHGLTLYKAMEARNELHLARQVPPDMEEK